MSDQQAKFLPFNAINEFMLDDYRHEVIQKVFSNLQSLSSERRNSINGMVKRFVTIPGFRNSAQAPAMMKIKAGTNTFVRNPAFTAQILQAWAELNPELGKKIYDMLKARNWEVLPPETDRSKLPGFLIEWPKTENYDVLDQAFADMYPNSSDSTNDIRLMIVWTSARLPYTVTGDEDEGGEDQAEA
jgi:hypothetical protein